MCAHGGSINVCKSLTDAKPGIASQFAVRLKRRVGKSVADVFSGLLLSLVDAKPGIASQFAVSPKRRVGKNVADVFSGLLLNIWSTRRILASVYPLSCALLEKTE